MFHFTLPGMEVDISYCFFNSRTDRPVSLHIHPCFELVFVNEPGTHRFIINPPLYKHSAEPLSSDKKISSLLFSPIPGDSDIVSAVFRNVKQPISLSDTFGGGERIATVNRILSELPFGAKEEAASELRLLFISLARAVYPTVTVISRPAEQTLDDERMSRLERFFSVSFRDPKCSKLTLADELGVSERHLSRILHDIYGKNFHALLLESRMSLAKAMIETGKSISDAASSVGYTSLRTFKRAYNAYFGHNSEN